MAGLVSGDLSDLLSQYEKMTHSGTAILFSARLENTLAYIIQSSMPNLSNVTKKKMFEGYGPLGSFSSKIDIAHALGFIDARASRSLHAVREIRNEFAHSEDGEISFHHPSIVELCKKLPNKQNKDRSLAGHFIDACKEVNESLVKCIESNLLVKRPNGYSRNQGG